MAKPQFSALAFHILPINPQDGGHPRHGIRTFKGVCDVTGPVNTDTFEGPLFVRDWQSEEFEPWSF